MNLGVNFMKIKKSIIILLILFLVTGCTNLKSLSYDDIIKKISENSNYVNTYRKGYRFYTPNGLRIDNAGTNYVIFSSNTVNYYLYLDFINYDKKQEIKHEVDKNSIYNKEINNEGFFGYVDIKMLKNNQYLIEIMYNYAKIEVMVDKDMINEALINSISILKSIRYNDTIIKNILESDSLDYTEEIFDLFKDVSSNSNTLEYEDDKNDEDVLIDDEIKDNDYVN